MYRLIAILLIVVPGVCLGRTLTEADLPGIWIDAWLDVADTIEPSDRMPVRNILVIEKGLRAKLTRAFDSGTKQVMTAAADRVSFRDDLLVAEFIAENVRYKLVLSGWAVSGEKLLFGHLYLYNEKGLFNGIPVGFKPGVDDDDAISDQAPNTGDQRTVQTVTQIASAIWPPFCPAADRRC